MIARMTEYVKITLYVPEDHISSNDMEKINRAAGDIREKVANCYLT